MKKPIPKALREQVWIAYVGRKFESKCYVSWCKNKITVFDFQCGHNVPESKGGSTDLKNLFPICSRCNLSMGDDYTLIEWMKKSKPLSSWDLFILKLIPITWRQYDIKENGIQSLPNPMSQNDKKFKLRGFWSKIQAQPPKKRIARGTKPSKKT